ncbi:MAG: hypothetical protein QOH93_2879, partial [Chloroflexia bacterium]|nr:hypothetical protein [Chloroflexia bacterium]
TQILDSVAKYQREHFINSHKGRLAWFKKLIQPDLGLFSYASHIIGTTHIMFSYLAQDTEKVSSLDPNVMTDVSSTGYPIAYDIGKYIARLYSDLVLPQYGNFSGSCSYTLDDSLVQSKDVISGEYFRKIFNGPLSLQVSYCLMMFLSFANFVHYMLVPICVGGSYPLFKLKYLTLYHLSTSLEKLSGFYYPQGAFSETSKSMLALILKDKELRSIRSQLKFRNILVHYSLDEAAITENKLDAKSSLFGLVEHYFGGRTMEELGIMVDRQLARVSGHLETWLRTPLASS